MTRLGSYIQIKGIPDKLPCFVATSENIEDFTNSAPNMIDGENLYVSARILLWQQTKKEQNGIYCVEKLGDGNNGVWKRAIDFSETEDVYRGISVRILDGITYKNKIFVLDTKDPIVLNATELDFSELKLNSTRPSIKIPELSIETSVILTDEETLLSAKNLKKSEFFEWIDLQKNTLYIFYVNEKMIALKPLDVTFDKLIRYKVFIEDLINAYQRSVTHPIYLDAVNTNMINKNVILDKDTQINGLFFNDDSNISISINAYEAEDIRLILGMKINFFKNLEKKIVNLIDVCQNQNELNNIYWI